MKKFDVVSTIKTYALNECDSSLKELVESARKATQTAYAPYSGYQVGAAVLLENGQIVTGSNQENAAYPSGLCAERTALFYANAHYPDTPVAAVAIAAFNKGDYSEEVCTPCGSCRQVFAEIEMRYNKPVRIIMCGRKEIYEVESIQALLPLSFGKGSLA
ncbi:MAG: cytidine deaminase [Prevotella sp.]|jgi:cytidine deaminase|nr:cytidine deaminase [Prevotella sp.]